jgi:hypothetical protein
MERNAIVISSRDNLVVMWKVQTIMHPISLLSCRRDFFLTELSDKFKLFGPIADDSVSPDRQVSLQGGNKDNFADMISMLRYERKSMKFGLMFRLEV